MPRPRYVGTKEIAAALEISQRSVQRRERQLGLHHYRDRVCQKPRRYFTEGAERALRDNGHEVTF